MPTSVLKKSSSRCVPAGRHNGVNPQTAPDPVELLKRLLTPSNSPDPVELP
jgi:hypothetical protein